MAWRTSSSKLHPGAEAWPRAQGTRSLQGSLEQHLPWADSNRAPRFQQVKWCLPSGQSLQTLSSSHHDPGIRSAETEGTERPQVKVGGERAFMQTNKYCTFSKKLAYETYPWQLNINLAECFYELYQPSQQPNKVNTIPSELKASNIFKLFFLNLVSTHLNYQAAYLQF